MHVVVEVRVVEALLRARAAAGQSRGGLIGEGVEADPLLAPHLVEEDVGRDPVQPALEGAGLVGVQRAEHPDEDVLGEVLGVVHVARQAVGQPVDPGGVLLHDLLPGGGLPASSRRLAVSRGMRRRHRFVPHQAAHVAYRYAF